MLVKKKALFITKGSFYNTEYYKYTFTRMSRGSRNIILMAPISRIRRLNSDLKVWIYDLTYVKSHKN